MVMVSCITTLKTTEYIKNNWTLEMGELYGVSYISKKKKLFKKKNCMFLGLQLLKREWKRLRQKAQIATISGPFINLLIS